MLYGIVYGLLLVTILFNYFLSQGQWEGFKSILIALTAIKFILITFYFMKMRLASVAWKIILFLLIGTFSGLVMIF